MRLIAFAFVFVFALLAQVGAAEARMCSGGKSGPAAATFSALHAGVGEWYLKGWGPFERAPQNKFWLGFIPLYGWPYLSIRSAIDASRCETLDRAY